MAVIDGLEGLEAWVEVNDQRAQEYSKPDGDDGSKDMEATLIDVAKVTNKDIVNFDDVKDIPYVIKYIEAIQDQRFSIHVKNAAGFPRKCHHLGIMYTVDNSDTEIEHSAPEYQDQEWTDMADNITLGNDTDGWKIYYYKFGEVKHVDEADLTAEQVSEAMRDAGRYAKIRASVYLMSASGMKQALKSRDLPCCLARQIPENAVKGAAITTINTYDVTSLDTRPSWADEEPIDTFQDPLKRPFAIFEFRYRSREGLYQEGILERPYTKVKEKVPERPDPVYRERIPEASDPIDNLSLVELRRLARIGLDYERRQAIKREDNDDNVDIKQENGGTTLNRKRPTHGALEPDQKRFKETIRYDGKVEIDLD